VKIPHDSYAWPLHATTSGLSRSASVPVGTEPVNVTWSMLELRLARLIIETSITSAKDW
jgi:hypothetical protein